MKRIRFVENWTVQADGTRRSPVPITLPHDAMLHEKRSADSPGSTGGAFYHGGKYRYENRFDVPDTWRDKTVCMEFEGVYPNAVVSINGQKAAVTSYGYVNFIVPCDAFLRYGEENTVLVEVDNTKMPNTRWYSGSGIYRPVWLYVAEKTHIALRGVRVSTLSYAPAKIRVDAEIIGDAQVHIEICYRGEVIARAMGASVEIDLLDAKLWSADEPNLYLCRVMLEADGKTVDTSEETFGIRMIEHSAKGLFINGKSVKLRGGCIHHDNGILGACAYDEAEERRVKILKAAGFNAIRSAHNPCSVAMLRACDEHGLYVIDEMWDMWYNRKNRYDYALDFMDGYATDIKAITKRDFNHPCVIMYSIGNENTEPHDDRGIALEKDIVSQFHAHDSTRPVTIGCNLSLLYMASKGKGVYKDPVEGEETKEAGSEFFNMLMMLFGVFVQKLAAAKAVDKAVTRCLDAVDIAGYNYASDRYAKDGKKHPDRLIYGSETMAYQIASNWVAVKKHDHVCGDFFWSAWDYMGEAGLGSWSYRPEASGRNKSYPWKIAEAGTIDILGNEGAEAVYAGFIWGTRKDPYIAITPPNHPGEKLHKAYWRGTNAISSWSFHGCDGNGTTVYVYADAYSVQVEVNGQVIGKKKLKNCKAAFKTTYKTGSIQAVAFDHKNKELSRCQLSSASGALRIALTPEVERPSAGEVVFVGVSLVGENGVVESNRDETLTVQIDGGELLGFGSAEPCTEEHFTEGIYTTYQGRALAAARRNEPGELILTATGAGLHETTKIIYHADKVI